MVQGVPLKQLSLDDAAWRRYVEARPDATPFHDPRWAGVLAECYRLTGFVLAGVSEEGAVLAGLPLLVPPRFPGRDRRLVSLPYTDELPPLVGGNYARQFVEAADSARQELGAERIELRGMLEGARPSAVTAVTHHLELPSDPELAVRAFSKTRRQGIRIAEGSSLRARRGEHEADLTEAFFDLHLQTRHRLGVPSQPKRFFRLLWQRIIEPGGGFVLVVERGGVPVASAVFLTGNGTIVYKYGASAREGGRENPNDLLLSIAIRHACEQGFHTFDFGRSELSGTGLRWFKSSWGAVETPLVYATIGAATQSDTAGGAGLAGRVLRRSPAWVTRAVGEAFYRYAA